ncbi:MAG: hypothetical protein P0111_13985 [Nitrospira sp.]|nr:hypothetical protein [Nitrospira sp.]
MPIVDSTNANDNWFEILALWSRIANWIHYRTSERELNRQIKCFLIFLWNEKDWLKEQYPEKSHEIESCINNSKYMGVVGNLANTVKHRRLTKGSRSPVTQTDYYGRITVKDGVTRRLHHINIGDAKYVEIMRVLRIALQDFEKLRRALR